MSCFTDARNEQGRHRCERCLLRNPVTGRDIYVMCGDGVSLTRHCCAHGQTEDEACRNLPVNARKHTCLAHDDEDAYCAVSDFANGVHEDGRYTCNYQRCKDLFVTWVNSRDSVQASLRQYMGTGSCEREAKNPGTY